MSDVQIPGYTVENKLGEGATSVVYRATRDGSSYAVKLMKEIGASPAEAMLRFRREAAALARLNHSNLVRVIEGGETGGRSYMVMELIEGPELTECIARGLTQERTIEIATMLAGALAEVHGRGLVHRDLKPANVIVDRSGVARIIDFGFVAANEQRADNDPEMVGTLLYAPPEQAGIVKRTIDNRSDLYSLGAVLFECLAGRTPFQAQSVPDLLHQLKSTVAPDLRSLDPSISLTLARIVAKLLAKNQDERYQTAEGLSDDLAKLGELEKQGPTAALDTRESRTYELPFVGREKEVGTLKKAWARVLQGLGSVLLVEGEGGLGKTRLVREVVSMAKRESEVLVLTCKCQQSESTPLGPLRDAIDEYVARLLQAPEDSRARGLQQLRQAAGDYAPLLKQLSSGFAKALPDIPDSRLGIQAPEISYDAMATLIVGLATTRAILVVDDVQWLDSGSRQVLKRVASRIKAVPYLLLATARNDASSEAARASLVAELKETLTSRVVLEPLSSEEVAKLIAVQLGGHALDQAFVEKLAVRANGNPFALGEYVRALLDSGAIRPARGTWQVDLSRVSDVTLPTDVLALVISRLQALGEDTIRVLRHAALVGMTFSRAFLEEIIGNKEQVASALQQGIAANMIERTDADVYGMVHDRVREALEAALSVEQRREVHQVIAEHMDKNAETSPAYVFALARHYMAGIPERNVKRLVESCSAAGALGLDAFANLDAQRFFGAALENSAKLPQGSTNLAALEEGLATASTRLGQLTDAKIHFDRALTLSSTPMGRARLRIGLLRLALTTWNIDEVVKQGQLALAEVGERLPSSRLGRWFSGVRYRFAFWLMKTLGRGYGSIEASDIPVAIMKLSIFGLWTFGTQTVARPREVSYIKPRIRYLAHILGSRREVIQPLTYYAYGLVVLKPKAAVAVAQAAADLADQLSDKAAAAEARAILMIAHFSAGDMAKGDAIAQDQLYDPEKCKWLIPRLRGFYRGQAGICYFERGMTREAIRDCKGFEETARFVDAPSVRAIITYCLSSADAVVGHFGSANKHLAEARSIAGFDVLTKFVAYGFALIAAYEQEDIEQTEHFTKLILELGRPARDQSFSGLHGYTFGAYGRLRRFLRAEPSQKVEARRALVEFLAELKSVARYPLQRAHALVIEATLERLSGRLKRALRLLRDAERQARMSDSPFALFEIARERARVFMAMEDSASARREAQTAIEIALQQSAPHRAKWVSQEFDVELPAASGLNQSIMRSRFQMSQSIVPRSQGDGAGVTPTDQYLKALLHVSVASASALDPTKQARAVLDELIPLLSAERAFLFVKEPQGGLKLQAGRSAERSDLPEATGYSTTVVNKVADSRRPLVVTGTAEGQLLGSESAVAHELRSIMAAPLVVRDNLIGVLYLDNHLVNGVFTADDAGILLAFANHIAVSIEMSRGARIEMERRAMEKEIELTAAVQNMFLPKQLGFKSEHIAVQGYYRPASKCSGDWWWYGQPNQDTISVFLGDVTGHGIAPAMVTASVATSVRNTVHRPAKDILEQLNRQILDVCGNQYRMTMAALEIDGKANTLNYLSAGAPPILILRADGTIETLLSAGTPLGAQEFSIGLKNRQVREGDRFFIFSDGLPELAIPSGRQLGIKRIAKFLEQTRKMDIEGAAQYIVAALDSARQDIAPDDDLTFALVDVF